MRRRFGCLAAVAVSAGVWLALPVAPAQAAFGYLGGWGTTGTARGQFEAPVDLALDGQGNVYVVDHIRNDVQKFSPAGRWLDSFGAPSGPPCTVTFKFPPPPGVLCVPSGVAVAGSSVYVVDTYGGRIQQFSTTGDFRRTWGSHYCGEGPKPSGPIFCYPARATVDREGNVYADDATASIQVFDGEGTPRAAWPGPLCALGGCFNQGLAAARSQDWLYVTDTFWGLVAGTASLAAGEGGSILSLGLWGGAGRAPGQFGDAAMQPGPQGLAVGPGGAVYAADNNNDRIQVFSSGGAFSFAFGEAGSGSGRLENPSGVAVAPSGTVYVADTDNDRVQVFGEQSAPPAPPVPPPNPTPPNGTAPKLVGLRTHPARFRPRGTRRRCRRGRCVRAGTTIILGLSEPASVTLEVTRRVGRRSRRVGALTRPGGGGLNRLRWSGRLKGHPLARGRYVVTARATDRAGVRSNVARRRFRIVR